RVRAGHQSGPKGRHVHDAKHGVRPQLMWTLPPLILFWPDARLTMWVPLIITLPSAVRRREDLPQRSSISRTAVTVTLLPSTTTSRAMGGLVDSWVDPAPGSAAV